MPLDKEDKYDIMKMKIVIIINYKMEREMNMKKKLTILLAGVLALSSFAVGAMSKTIVEKIEAELRGDFTVVIDGKKQIFRDVDGNIVDPILYEGTTYLPIRAIGEIMGKKVYWYQDKKKIELVDDSDRETLVTDADVIVNSEGNNSNHKAEKREDRTEIAKITLEKAKSIALKKAGLNAIDVTFTKAKLERDDGKLVYEIDFKTENKKYDAEVDAETGAVTEWEIEETRTVAPQGNTEVQITLEKAKSIALKKAGLNEADVTFTKAKLERDDGRAVYDIEFRKDRIEYEAEIDATDGTVIEWDVGND